MRRSTVQRATTVSWVAENGHIETHTEHRVFAHFQEQSTTLQMAAVVFQRITLTHDNGSYAAHVGIVSPGYFETLGARLVIGRLALSLAVTTVMAPVLYGVSPTDPVTFAGVFVALTAASLLASYLPTRRAANTDPMVVLRTE